MYFFDEYCTSFARQEKKQHNKQELLYRKTYIIIMYGYILYITTKAAQQTYTHTKSLHPTFGIYYIPQSSNHASKAHIILYIHLIPHTTPTTYTKHFMPCFHQIVMSYDMRCYSRTTWDVIVVRHESSCCTTSFFTFSYRHNYHISI